MLITLEGIDGSGKSTLVERLRATLADLDPVITREPGATWVGDAVRRAVKERADPVTEALLFAADHAAHLDRVVRPALEAGRLVISDRYTDSRYAYQSVTLEGTIPSPLSWLEALHAGWTLRPDRTFLLILPVEEAMRRIGDHENREHFESPEILARVQSRYLDLASADPTRFVIIDALKEKEEIHAFVESAIRRLAEWSRTSRRS
ncbi:MAG: dTMP kinase [Methanomicrobiales archaeon]|nr:dTMP kinase [Methanomicrobiales archaeon]